MKQQGHSGLREAVETQFSHPLAVSWKTDLTKCSSASLCDRGNESTNFFQHNTDEKMCYNVEGFSTILTTKCAAIWKGLELFQTHSEQQALCSYGKHQERSSRWAADNTDFLSSNFSQVCLLLFLLPPYSLLYDLFRNCFTSVWNSSCENPSRASTSLNGLVTK